MQLSVDSTAWEMAQFEIHELRNELSAAYMLTAVYASEHRTADALLDQMYDSKQVLDAAMLAALRDPARRKVRR
jgi:hypothetical protein